MHPKPHHVFFVGPILLFLALLFVVALFVVQPPPLAWIGLGVVAVIALGIAATASALYSRSRTNGPRLHPHAGDRYRLLVLADTHCDVTIVCDGVKRAVRDRAAEVLIVAPVLPSPLHFLTNAEESEIEDARVRLMEALQASARVGVEARGMLGGDDPLQAIGDALGNFHANEILLVVPEHDSRSWLEDGLERKARDTYGVPVSSVALDRLPH